VRLRPALPAAARNPLSLTGATLATAMAALFLALFALEFLGYLTNPYIGLVTFVVIPALFLAGLALVPLGVWPRQRPIVVGVAALTVVNLLIVSLAAYGGVRYLDSSEFCGQVCHTTMEPQYVAHQSGPHARVACSACHVGSGAGAFVGSKLAGARRLLHVAAGSVARPVPTPTELLQPARNTCERCHWTERVHGDRVRLLREYASDERSTETVTTLRMHVGGGSAALGIGSGIHWHMNVDNEIEYVATDPQGDTIPYVRLRNRRDGSVREFVVGGTAPETLATGVRRRMDCTDCHSRPAHTFFATAERAVDTAIAQGRIPRALPFARREALAAVTAEYADRDAALAGIARRLEAFYAQAAGGEAGGDRRGLLQRAVAGTRDVWASNVFPAMRVTWGTYRSQLGHVDAPGCFRCHDDQHSDATGRVIRQDCELCHTVE
jgi:hypothetical protein